MVTTTPKSPTPVSLTPNNPTTDSHTPKSPTTPCIPQSRPGSPTGWYEASVLSDMQDAAKSCAENRSRDQETVVTPIAMSSRERVRSIASRRRQQQLQAENTEGDETKSVVSSQSIIPPLPHTSGQVQHMLEETPVSHPGPDVTIVFPQEGKPLNVAGDDTHTGFADHPVSPLTVNTTPTTPLNLKPRKKGPLTRLEIEKEFSPDPIGDGPNIEKGLGNADQHLPYKLNPLQRAIETFFLLLPVLGTVYLLGSCCVPTAWWRERLSIVRITLGVGENDATGELPSLLIGAFGWCVQEATQETTCSRAEFIYSMGEFFALQGYGESAPSPSAFVAPTMKAFISLIPSVLLACTAAFFVLIHIYKRCVRNDRRCEAGKWEHLVILLALMSTIEFSVVMKVFATQLADGAPGIVMVDGTVPLLVLASIVLLSISLAASVIPSFVARARSQYMYHVRNTAANRAKHDKSDQDDSPFPIIDGEPKQDLHHAEDPSAECKAANRLTMFIGKRATKLFGPCDMEAPRVSERDQSNVPPVPYMPEPPQSAILEEANPRRKSAFKRLTLKAMSVVR